MSEMTPVTIVAVVRASDEGVVRRERFSIQLAEAGGSRPRYIGVGDAEAAALSFSLQGPDSPRPMTYQFTAALLAAAGSGVRRVRITRVADGIFYAQVLLTNGALVDARPSDAVNLAAATRAPVYVATELLDLPTAPHQPVS